MAQRRAHNPFRDHSAVDAGTRASERPVWPGNESSEEGLILHERCLPPIQPHSVSSSNQLYPALPRQTTRLYTGSQNAPCSSLSAEQSRACPDPAWPSPQPNTAFGSDGQQPHVWHVETAFTANNMASQQEEKQFIVSVPQDGKPKEYGPRENCHASSSKPSDSGEATVEEGSDPVGWQEDGQLGGGSFSAATFNYVNCIIGSGIIGMPYALAQAGFFLGILLLIFVGILTDHSLRIMVKAAQISGTTTYQDMMEAAFGRPGFMILTVVQLAYPFIAMVSYNVISGDTLVKLVVAISGSDPNKEPSSFLVSRGFLIVASTLLITLPLSLYKDLNRLAKVSFLSIIFVLFILVTILMRMPAYGAQIPSTPGAWSLFHSGIPKAVGIISFAYLCHHNTFLLYESMKNRSQQKWEKVTHTSVGISCVILLVCAVGGYSTFTGHTQGDLLQNYCWHDQLINFSRLFFCLAILLTFPIECFVCRQVLMNLFNIKRELSRSEHMWMTLIVVGLSCLVSLSTDCLGIVLEINGIFAAVPLAFIFPGLSYMKLSEGIVERRELVFPMVMTVFGCLVSLSGLIMMLDEGVSNCGTAVSQWYCKDVD